MSRTWKSGISGISGMSGRFALGAGLGLVVAACGGGADDESNFEPPDVTPPQIVNSTPAEGAVAVSVLTTVSVTLDERIDPATVDGAVALYARFNPERVPGTTTYDDSTLTLTFTPTLPLLHAERYALRVAPTLTDLTRNPIMADGATVSFNTKLNSATVRVDRSATGQQIAGGVYILDAQGRPTEDRYFNSPGTDNAWQTGDDTLAGRYVRAFGPAGQILTEGGYAPGPDGLLGTADDETSDLTTHAWDADVREVGFANVMAPGTDGVWNTADDVLSSVFTNTLQGDLLMSTTLAFGAGADGTWRTGDDDLDYISTFTFGADETPTRLVGSRAGADKRAGTADDVIREVRDTTYEGGLRAWSSFLSKGADDTFLTSDDGYVRVDRYTRDDRGRLITMDECDAAGTDGLWRTADDVIASRTRFSYNDQGLMVMRADFMGPGVDGVWGTTDDVQRYREVVTRDAEGNAMTTTSYSGPGTDGLWNTSDDVIGFEAIHDTSR